MITSQMPLYCDVTIDKQNVIAYQQMKLNHFSTVRHTERMSLCARGIRNGFLLGLLIPQGTQAQQKTTVGNIYLLSTKLLIWCYYRHIDFKQHNKDIILISKIIL